METVYQALNKNIDETNLLSNVKEMTVTIPSSYPASMDVIKFQSNLKVRATGCTILQCLDKSTYKPVCTSNPAWIENNGIIEISDIQGLQASKTYIIRFRVT